VDFDVYGVRCVEFELVLVGCLFVDSEVEGGFV